RSLRVPQPLPSASVPYPTLFRSKGFIKSQMAQYGHMDPKDEELEGIAARVLGNQDEVRRLSEQLMSQKLLDLYKEKANLKVKEVDRKSTRLNSSHVKISYAVFCW